MITALTFFAVLIVCMFLATMSAAVMAMREEEEKALDAARGRSRLAW